jgi:hypothetical protein
MSIVVEKNDMRGKSVYIGSVVYLAKVPAKHRRLECRNFGRRWELSENDRIVAL